MRRGDLQRADGVWKFTGDHRRGHPRVVLVDQHGKRITRKLLVGLTDAQAVAWCVEENHRREQARQDVCNPVFAVHRASASTLLKSEIEGYLRDRDAEVKRGDITEATFEYTSEKLGHWSRIYGDTPLAQLETPDAWRRYMQIRSGEGAHPHTLRKEALYGRAVLLRAYEGRRFGVDPRTLIKTREFRGVYVPVETWITIEDFRRLVRHFADAPRSKIAAARAAHVASFGACGWRDSEAAGASRDDLFVDQKGRRGIRVRSAKVKRGNRAQAKKKQFRDCFFTQVSAEFVEFMIEHAPGKAGEPLFLSWPNIRRDLRVAATALQIGLRRERRNAAGVVVREWWTVSPNDLRRSFVTWHARVGFPRHALADMLGNSSRMIAEVYEQTTREDKADAIAEFLPATKPGPHPTSPAKVIRLADRRRRAM